jgi:hypothetical protein
MLPTVAAGRAVSAVCNGVIIARDAFSEEPMSQPATSTPAPGTVGPDPLWSALVGLTTLGVLLQGLWAGIFLSFHDDRKAMNRWVDVHSVGADVTVLLALLAAVVAVWRLRARRELMVPTIVLFVLLVVEMVLGSLIREQHDDALTAVHVPLAMLVMGMAVWLPVRARARR